MTQTIKIKRSTSAASPTALANGELAYSATGGNPHKLFIGRPGGGSGDIDAIGGAYYTALIDAATNANTASAIVKRDGSGDFAAGTITAALSGNATTASALASARTISLAGDVTGSVSFDGSANASITTTIAANSIALGTDTTGNYVATVAGTANEIEVSGSGSETSAVTIGLPAATKVTTSMEVGGADGVTIEDGSVEIKNSGTQSKVDFYSELEIERPEQVTGIGNNIGRSLVDTSGLTAAARASQRLIGQEFQLATYAYTANNYSAGSPDSVPQYSLLNSSTATGTTSTLVIRQALKTDSQSASQTFTITVQSGFALQAGSEQIFLNGVLQTAGASSDYTITGNDVTFIDTISNTDSIYVTYLKDSSS